MAANHVQHSPIKAFRKPSGPLEREAGGSGADELAEYLALDYPALAQYLGDSRFRAAAFEFHGTIKIGADQLESARRSFAGFVAQSALFSHSPEIAELAQLEQSFQVDFGARPHTPIDLADASELEEKSRLRLHPSVKIWCFKQNTTSLWSAIKCGEAPPRPYQLDLPQHVLVWHYKSLPRFRILGDDEAEAIAAFSKRPSNASAYFRGWVEAGLIVLPVK